MNLSHLIKPAIRYHADMSDGFLRSSGLSVFRRDVESGLEAFVYSPILCLILQGGKATSAGDQCARVGPGDALIVSHDLPVVSRITHASADTPYLALILTLDLGLIRGLYLEMDGALHPGGRARALSAGPADPAWLGPLTRYLQLQDDPLAARILGPAILREIHFRLLLSPNGELLRNLVLPDSHASRVAKAIGDLRAGFRTPIRVSDMARTAGMSASSFHDHFKSVTGTTPLQYLKDLRLIEARKMLVERALSVSDAAFAVGYESPTHFSRDYSRKFGLPPSRDAIAPTERLAV